LQAGRLQGTPHLMSRAVGAPRNVKSSGYGAGKVNIPPTEAPQPSRPSSMAQAWAKLERPGAGGADWRATARPAARRPSPSTPIRSRPSRPSGVRVNAPLASACAAANVGATEITDVAAAPSFNGTARGPRAESQSSVMSRVASHSRYQVPSGLQTRESAESTASQSRLPQPSQPSQPPSACSSGTVGAPAANAKARGGRKRGKQATAGALQTEDGNVQSDADAEHLRQYVDDLRKAPAFKRMHIDYQKGLELTAASNLETEDLIALWRNRGVL